MTESKRDRLFSEVLADPSLFTFNEEVVEVFPDMIKRSVPGYTTIVAMTGLLAQRHAVPDTVIYDLGCSLGESLRAAEDAIPSNSCRLVGIDNSQAMINRAQLQFSNASHIDWQLADITAVKLEPCSVVILNFTLQFIPVDQRLALLSRIREALVPGGLLILSEKLAMDDPAMDQLLIDMHHDFKRAQGYSDLEIAQKRSSLETVLIPETATDHRARLKAAGFSRSDVWFQCLNFASLIAIA